jgi:hypothetical protein
MSDSFLRLIPEEPPFEPSYEASEAAVRTLKALMPTAVVSVKRFPEIRFVDQGSNFERIRCPNCQREITSHWSSWMDVCARRQFAQRMTVMPCCKKESDLNDLVYEWPAGFARFVLEVANPDPAEWLASPVQKRLETVLGCAVRQILAHY